MNSQLNKDKSDYDFGEGGALEDSIGDDCSSRGPYIGCGCISVILFILSIWAVFFWAPYKW